MIIMCIKIIGVEYGGDVDLYWFVFKLNMIRVKVEDYFNSRKSWR